MKYERIDLTKYVVIPVWNGCNNKCTICMLGGLKTDLPIVSFDSFKIVVDKIIDDGRVLNLILTGAEITTFIELEKYIKYIVDFKWFRKIQIQTNCRKLSELSYLENLIDGGINEFFVSIHGLEEIHDAITRVKGSYLQTIAGLRNLSMFPVNVITNTVLTTFNYRDIPALVRQLSWMEAITELHIWNFFPMETQDSKDLIVSMADFKKLLHELVEIVGPTGKPLVLKSFPDCLSVGEPAFFDGNFPVTVLHDLFWEKFVDNGFGQCFYREQCKTDSCWGLSRAYIAKYGNERELLTPFL